MKQIRWTLRSPLKPSPLLLAASEYLIRLHHMLSRQPCRPAGFVGLVFGEELANRFYGLERCLRLCVCVCVLGN